MNDCVKALEIYVDICMYCTEGGKDLHIDCDFIAIVYTRIN